MRFSSIVSIHGADYLSCCYELFITRKERIVSCEPAQSLSYSTLEITQRRRFYVRSHDTLERLVPSSVPERVSLRVCLYKWIISDIISEINLGISSLTIPFYIVCVVVIAVVAIVVVIVVV